MYEYTVDFSEVKTEEGLHQALKDNLPFPDFYGMNMDAFWDCLTGFMNAPATIYLRGVNTMLKKLPEETELMLKIFDRAVHWYAGINQVFQVVVID